MYQTDIDLYKHDMDKFSSYDIRLGGAGRIRCEPGWRLGPSFGPQLHDYDLWLIWGGKGEMKLKTGTIPLIPGVAIWMRPGRYYSAEQSIHDRLGVTFVHFDLVKTKKHSGKFTLPPEHFFVSDLYFYDNVLRRIVTLLLRAKNFPREKSALHENAEQLMKGIILEIQRETHGHSRKIGSPEIKSHHRKNIEACMAAIQENPTQAKSVLELARQVGCHPDHFTRLFRQIAGVSPEKFIMQNRIERACQLLTGTDLSVTEISDLLGYSDIFFFSKQFRTKTRQTPTQYRKFQCN